MFANVFVALTITEIGSDVKNKQCGPFTFPSPQHDIETGMQKYHLYSGALVLEIITTFQTRSK